MTECFKTSKDNQKGRQPFLWGRACLPALFSGCAFTCFAFIYWSVTARAITPYYVEGLFLAVPGLIFALIAFLAGKGKLDNTKTAVFTLILVPVLAMGSFMYLFMISMDATSATVTDVSRYERTLKLCGYPENKRLAVFPEKIPKDAANVVFYYNKEGWMDPESTAILRFSACGETIGRYAERVKESAVYEESADNTGIKNGWDRVGGGAEKNLPADYTMYVIINTGKNVCVVSVSRERNDIIFYAGYFSWIKDASDTLVARNRGERD